MRAVTRRPKAQQKSTSEGVFEYLKMRAEREQAEAMAKIDLEREKLKLERDRLNFEKQKFEKMYGNKESKISDEDTDTFDLFHLTQ